MAARRDYGPAMIRTSLDKAITTLSIAAVACCILAFLVLGLLEDSVNGGDFDGSFLRAVLLVLLFGAGSVLVLAAAVCAVIRIGRHGWHMPWSSAVPGLLALILVGITILGNAVG